ncbi:helix-turn-helix domain-containing protein, partial [Ruminococcus sp. RTP21484sp1_RTP31023st1_H8_RTP31023_210422]|uniref:helix-turn-helix domain-containing protein n=1 Tax=Ruminococcus sp. RTP21484sp1_RTP31023st1_H8_RTP31023_210422 TaxID=3141611 RepID=UPI0034A52F4E
GCTPSKYLINLRMNHAQHLLVHEPGLSVKQIGEMCGYHDQGYFSRIFKKHTGKSPLEFRG